MIEKIKAEIKRQIRLEKNSIASLGDFGQSSLINALENLLSFIESLEKEQPKKINVTGDDFAWIDELKHDLEHPEELDKKVAEALKKKKEQPKGYDEAYLKEKIALAKKNGSWEEEQPQGLDSEDDNLARFAMYWYGDGDSMFLSNVFVGKDMRHHGCGNFILEAADEVANMYNADRIYLKTKKGSFAHKWYKRHGYIDDEPDEEDKTMIWMKKEV